MANELIPARPLSPEALAAATPAQRVMANSGESAWKRAYEFFTAKAGVAARTQKENR